MSRLFVGTRKGLFILGRGAAGWSVDSVHFIGDPVSLVLPDARDGAVYAALNLGHFGAKLHRSDDGGATFREVAAPAFAQDEPPDEGQDKGPSVEDLWALRPGGTDQPGRLWAGTIPGGLFRSDDRGDSWTLVRSLWDHPSRLKWFGGGRDRPGGPQPKGGRPLDRSSGRLGRAVRQQDGARRDGVDTHLRRQLQRQPARQRQQTGLGDEVG